MILWIQAIYYLVTGLWGLIDIESFMAVTGPKTDLWLVRTVSLLLVAISAAFIAHLCVKGNQWPPLILAICSCISLAGIDFYYAERDIISNVYLLDGILQLAFLVCLSILMVKFLLRKQKAI